MSLHAGAWELLFLFQNRLTLNFYLKCSYTNSKSCG
jgi:hypothetical protein